MHFPPLSLLLFASEIEFKFQESSAHFYKESYHCLSAYTGSEHHLFFGIHIGSPICFS